MFRFKTSAFILLLLIPAAELSAGDRLSAIIKKVKARVETIHNYEADMIMTVQFKPFHKKPVIQKAHVYYNNGVLRVEMTEPGDNVYLFKGDDKYEFNKETKKFESSKMILPDFYHQELIGSIINFLINLDLFKDKKLISKKDKYQIICNTSINQIHAVINKKNYTIEKVLSFMDSEQMTEIIFEYKKEGRFFMPVKKSYNDLNNKTKPNILVELKNIKCNQKQDKSLFAVIE